MTPLTKLVDFADIDVILVSNYMTMLALPFITENTGFKGVVYMTEPTLHIGKYAIINSYFIIIMCHSVAFDF